MVAASLYCSRDNDLMAKQETGLFLNLSVLETPVASFYRHRFLNQKMFFFHTYVRLLDARVFIFRRENEDK